MKQTKAEIDVKRFFCQVVLTKEELLGLLGQTGAKLPEGNFWVDGDSRTGITINWFEQD